MSREPVTQRHHDAGGSRQRRTEVSEHHCERGYDNGQHESDGTHGNRHDHCRIQQRHPHLLPEGGRFFERGGESLKDFAEHPGSLTDLRRRREEGSEYVGKCRERSIQACAAFYPLSNRCDGLPKAGMSELLLGSLQGIHERNACSDKHRETPREFRQDGAGYGATQPKATPLSGTPGKALFQT
jgi:hypothetical protein